MWSDHDFRTRVERRAREIGKTRAQVMREANVSRDYLDHEPKDGRQIGKIMAIADALNWTLAEVLGLSVEPHQMVNEAIDAVRLRRALEAAERIVTANGMEHGRSAAIAGRATRIYRILTDAENRGEPVTDKELALIEAALR